MALANRRMIIRIATLTLAAAVGWLVPASAQAACVAPGYNPSGSFCNGCRYEGTMSMSRDQVCERPNTPGAMGSSSLNTLAFISERITQRAKHGIAGASGNTVAYAPAKGYVGKDEFTMEVEYR